MELESRVKKLEIYGRLLSIGLFLWLYLIFGYTYIIVKVIVEQAAATNRLSTKFPMERRGIRKTIGKRNRAAARGCKARTAR